MCVYIYLCKSHNVRFQRILRVIQTCMSGDTEFN